MSVRSQIQPLASSQSQLMLIGQATLGALALALLSQVKIALPGTPVPLTLQVLAVILLGGALGPRLAVAAVAEYLLLGVCGLPVFTNWSAGLGTMLGATGGYLLAFLPAAALCGAIYHRFATRPYGMRVVGAALTGLAGVVVIYLGGWVWLAGWAHISLAKAFVAGVAPFVMVDILKVSAAASLLALRRKGAA